MPFYFSGTCYPTNTDALQAFQKTFPILGDANWQWHNTSSVSGAGLITYSVTQKPSTTNTTANRTGTIQLTSCTVPDLNAFDPAIAGAVFGLFFVGIVGTYLLSQNIGLILEAIKRW